MHHLPLPCLFPRRVHPGFIALFLVLAGGGPGFAEAPDAVIRLWEGPAPGMPADPPPEEEVPGGRVKNVSIPTLDAYFPDPAVRNGAVLIVCSGGGYGMLASGPLGEGGSDFFRPDGYTVFSLKYRLRQKGRDVRADSLADAERAVRLIRSRAGEWGIDTNRIAMVGFSAGANLLLNLSLNHDPGDPQAEDPIERFSSRPNAVGLCSSWPFGWKADQFEAGPQVPPAFVAHTRDDTTAPFSFAEHIVAEWRRNGIPVEFIIRDTGGHAAFSGPFKTGRSKEGDWMDRFKAWLKSQGIAP